MLTKEHSFSKKEECLISVLILSKKNLAKYLFVLVITIVAISIFSPSLKQTTQEVIAVLVSGQRLVPIYAVETDEKVVAISFDAAWGSTRTQDILKTLAENDIKTTFFLTNIWLKKYPELARQIVEEGHEVALHSASHPDMSKLSVDEIKKELQDNETMIKEITGQSPVLFRPPFGAYNNILLKTAEDLSFITVQWSIDSLDWKNLSADEIYTRVTERITPGAIVLFHNDGKNTPQALIAILNHLKNDGYSVIPISQLLHKDNYFIDHQGLQRLKE